MSCPGLAANHLKTIVDILARYDAIEQAVLFGSRAKGCFHDRSDVALALFGEGVSRQLMATLTLDFDDSDLPVLVDAVNYQEIKNQALLDHIKRVGLAIYRRGSAL